MVVRKLKDLVGALEVSGLYIAVDPALTVEALSAASTAA
jgi:hypothetical protein